MRAAARDQSPAVDDALRAAGLTRRWLESDERPGVSLRQEVDFFHAMSVATGRTLFGLETGAGIEPKGATLISFLLFAAPDLRAAAGMFERYAAVDRSNARPYLSDEGRGLVAFVFDPIDPYERLRPQSRDFRTAVTLRYLDAALGRRLPLRRVEMARREPRSGEAPYRRTFGAPVRFAAERSALVFESVALDWPIVSSDDELARHLRAHAETLLRERAGQRPELAQRIERTVLESLPGGGLGLDDLADQLGLSRRTLSRRMSKLGISLRAVREALRRELAAAHLADGRLTLAEIAYLLGYAEPAAFTNAYKRWTGEPPSRQRRGRVSAA